MSSGGSTWRAYWERDEFSQMKKAIVIKSLIYKTVERFSVKGLGFIISILLARLLSPDAFGQIAIVTVFVNLSQSIIEGGLGTALVQSREVDDRDYSTVFYICMAMAAVMTGIIYLAAPLVAGYYSSPEILSPLRVYAFSGFFSSYGSILTAKIQREMRFRQMMVCSLAATIISGSLAVAIAFAGAGIWTLVVYYFSHTVISCFAMMIAVRWAPKLSFSLKRAKELYSFGWKMLAATIMRSIYSDIRSLIIGKRFSTADLGYYDRGQQFPMVITLALEEAMQSVMFPVLAKSQDDRGQMRDIMQKTLSLGSLMVFPAMIGLAAVAEPLVKLLLTDKWLPCVPFMQIICIAQVPFIVSTSNLVPIKAMGRSDIYMKLEFFRRAAMLIVLIVTVVFFHSVRAIAYGYALSAWLDVFIVSIPNRRFFGYGVWGQIKDTWKIFAASVIMGAAVLAINYIPISVIFKLLIQIFCGVAVYMAMCRILKVDIFMYALDMLKKLFKGEKLD